MISVPFLAAVGALMMAGVFFAFSSFIMAGLGRVPLDQGIAAMQAINVTAINPLFMGLLFGTAALCLWLVITGVMNGAPLQAAAGALYVVGVIGVTMVRNVPMNNALAAAAPADAALWADYLRGWTLWNHIRGFAAFAAGLALLMGRTA